MVVGVVPPFEKSTETRKSPCVRSPWKVPSQGKPVAGSVSVDELAAFKVTGFCRNSRSTWLSPLLTTRSKPAKTSLVSVQAVELGVQDPGGLLVVHVFGSQV